MAGGGGGGRCKWAGGGGGADVAVVTSPVVGLYMANGKERNPIFRDQFHK